MKKALQYLGLVLIPLCHWFAISYLKNNFSLPDSVTALHFAALGFAYLYLLFGLLLLKMLLPKSRILKTLSFIGVAMLLTFFTVVYLGNLVSLKEWGEYISLDILQLFFTDSVKYLSMYGGIISNFVRIILLLIPALFLTKPLLNFYESLIAWFLRSFKLINFSRLSQSVIVALIATSSLFAFYQSSLRVKMQFKGEPLYNFFVPISSNFANVKLNPKEHALIEEYKTTEHNQINQPKNLVLIVVDAWRADRLPMYGYEKNNAPFLNELYKSERLVSIPLALSNCSTSFCGILSILSGKPIQELRIANYKIHDLLKEHGYQTNFLLSGAHNEWYQMERAYKYHYPIDVYFDGEANETFHVNDDLAIIERFANMNIDHSKAQFFYFHLMTSHRSGIREEHYRKHMPDSPLDGFNPDSLRFSNFYDNGVLQSDDYIKQIFSELEKKGLLENTVVAITADHGEALGERGRFGHAVDINQGNLHVPFLIYNSNTEASPLPKHISQAEMMAVLLNELNIEVPVFTNPIETDVTYHRQGNKLAVVRSSGAGCFKLMTRKDSNEYLLYELWSDPNETKDLFGSQAEVESELLELLNQAFQKN